MFTCSPSYRPWSVSYELKHLTKKKTKLKIHMSFSIYKRKIKVFDFFFANDWFRLLFRLLTEKVFFLTSFESNSRDMLWTRFNGETTPSPSIDFKVADLIALEIPNTFSIFAVILIKCLLYEGLAHWFSCYGIGLHLWSRDRPNDRQTFIRQQFRRYSFIRDDLFFFCKSNECSIVSDCLEAFIFN